VLNLLEFRAVGANDLLARSEPAGYASYWNLGIWMESWKLVRILSVDQLDD
jgi:hypothetical protein